MKQRVIATKNFPANCRLPLPTFPDDSHSLLTNATASRSPASELTLLRIASLVVLIIFSSCTHSPKHAQYLVQGERLYGQHCANCHQADGTGLGKLYPPLAGSDYLRYKPEEVICLIRNGIAGPIEVNGVIYDQPMPGNATLTDLEIAEVVTYIRGEWAGDKEMTEVTAVTSVLSSCK